MSQIAKTLSATTSSSSTPSDVINDVNLGDFLDLMIAELQNQDPLNPLENDQLIAQVGQIRQIGATDKLTETLDSVLLGQNITSATNLIGANIEALSDDNQRVTGIVERVSIANGQPKLHLEESSQITVTEDAESELEQGSYRYRVVWQDKSGNLFGVKNDDAVEISEDGQAVQLNNLPVTDNPKQIYRTKVGGDGAYYLVDTLASGKTSSYVDTTADADLSSTVLTKTPQYIDGSRRSYTVSLNNVGEIRPPE
jgi:flagellar hook assembly protein FlgD